MNQLTMPPLAISTTSSQAIAFKASSSAVPAKAIGAVIRAKDIAVDSKVRLVSVSQRTPGWVQLCSNDPRTGVLVRTAHRWLTSMTKSSATLKTVGCRFQRCKRSGWRRIGNAIPSGKVQSICAPAEGTRACAADLRLIPTARPWRGRRFARVIAQFGAASRRPPLSPPAAPFTLGHRKRETV